jgi:Bacterial Ig-like domain
MEWKKMAKTNHLGVLAAAAGVLVAVGILVRTMVALAEPAGAAFPGQNGKIAFTSDRDDPKYEIYTMSANGMGVDRLTTNPATDEYPDWQPLSASPSPPNNPNTTTAPKVTTTVPGANAKGVAPTANITATFSKKMKASSITATTFKLFKEGSKTKLGAAVSYSAATHKAKLNPTNSLQKGATYRAVVTTGAKDLAGNPLDQRHKWSFTVS